MNNHSNRPTVNGRATTGKAEPDEPAELTPQQVLAELRRRAGAVRKSSATLIQRMKQLADQIAAQEQQTHAEQARRDRSGRKDKA